MSKLSDEYRNIAFFYETFKLLGKNQDASVLIQWTSESRKEHSSEADANTPEET